MYAIRIILQRRRKMLMRFGALAILGFGGTLALLPGVDASAVPSAPTDPWAILLSPVPLASPGAATFSAITHR